MPANTKFKGFFSYAHHDANTEPTLIPAFTDDLENRVNAKLVNARFAIWRDQRGIRTGDLWSDTINAELRTADVLIVLLTPRWIDSDYCRKEYTVFEEVEGAREVGKYVAPILVRAMQRQERYLTDDQRLTYESIRTRQYANATEFLGLTRARRARLIEKIADDIVGMIDRLRGLAPEPPNATNRAIVSLRRPREFDSRAQDYEKVDFVTDGEIVLDRANGGRRDVLGHIGFVERLFVQGKKGRFEFGVRRAYLSLMGGGTGELSKADDVRSSNDKTRYYAILHDKPEAVTICMDPPPGRSSLAELPLPPQRGENFLSKIATATAETTPEGITAELRVSLDADGLYVAGGKLISPRTEAAIKLIMKVASAKQGGKKAVGGKSGLLRRSLPVRERS